MPKIKCVFIYLKSCDIFILFYLNLLTYIFNILSSIAIKYTLYIFLFFNEDETQNEIFLKHVQTFIQKTIRVYFMIKIIFFFV